MFPRRPARVGLPVWTPGTWLAGTTLLASPMVPAVPIVPVVPVVVVAPGISSTSTSVRRTVSRTVSARLIVVYRAVLDRHRLLVQRHPFLDRPLGHSGVDARAAALHLPLADG